MLTQEIDDIKEGEVESPHTDLMPLHHDQKVSDSRHKGIGSDITSPPPSFSFADTPLVREAKCTFCLSMIDIGDGDVATFGIGNTKPFHKICLKQLLPFIGIISFTSGREMYVKIKMEGGEEYTMHRIVMDNGYRVACLQALIRNEPPPDPCFYKNKRSAKRVGGVTRTKAKKEEKAVIMI